MIPRVIHFVYLGFDKPEMSKEWQDNLQIWRETHGSHMIVKVWSKTMANALLDAHYPWFKTTYEDLTYNIQRADAIRYCILHHEGGIYCDLDVRPTRHLESLVALYDSDPRVQVALCTSANVSIASNFFMISQPGAEFWWSVLQNIIDQHYHHRYFTQHSTIYQKSGPGLLNKLRREFDHNVVLIPVQVLDSCDVFGVCETSFRYIENQYAQKWNSSSTSIYTFLYGKVSGFKNIHPYKFVAFLFVLMMLVILMIYKGWNCLRKKNQ